MHRIEGSNGQVEFNGRTVRLTRGGFAGGASHLPAETIPIGAVTDVTVHAPHGLVPGFIHFHSLGDPAPTNYFGATGNSRTLVFKRGSADDIEALRAAVRAVIDARQR